MTLTGKDLAATVLTALAVFVFAATYGSWNVWLVGSSQRWAAGVMLLLGIATCSLGSPERDSGSKLLGIVGMVALVAAIWAIVTGAMAALWVLLAATVILWLGATVRHVWHAPHGAVPA
jgi:hypothetical protein